MSKKSDKVIIERESWETPGSPDYLAAKLTIVNAQVALRPGRKKGQLGDAPGPYVEIEYAGRIWETALVRATQQPKWNETFEVPIPPERRNQLGEIGIRVWDRNNSKKKAFRAAAHQILFYPKKSAALLFPFLGHQRSASLHSCGVVGCGVGRD
jgi:hypothetical protein